MTLTQRGATEYDRVCPETRTNTRIITRENAGEENPFLAKDRVSTHTHPNNDASNFLAPHYFSFIDERSSMICQEFARKVRTKTKLRIGDPDITEWRGWNLPENDQNEPNHLVEAAAGEEVQQRRYAPRNCS